MNKVHNVNLGGYPFTIDEDAYSAIQDHFADSDGCDEILDDIEARIAELFTEYLDGGAIVTTREFDSMVKVMGRPEDFGADPIDDYDDESTSDNHSKSAHKGKYDHIKTGKRLYRDEEDKVIGGVCSGIAAYFGIADPLWVRLIFLALVFLFGTSIVLYPLLWAITPKAETASDKLKMRGEPATVSNIAKTIEEELSELSSKISEISKDLSSKKKEDHNKRKSIVASLSPLRAVRGGMGLIGKLILSIVSAITFILKPIASFVIGALILSLGIAWAAWIIGFITSYSYLGYVGPSNWMMSTIGRMSLFFTVGIPIVGAMLLLTRWFSSYRIPQQWRTTMRLTWVASFILTAVAAISTASSYNHNTELTSQTSHEVDYGAIQVQRLHQPHLDTKGFLNMFGAKYGSKGLIANDISYDILRGESNSVEVRRIVRSNGQSYDEAQGLAENVDANILFEDGVINIPTKFVVKKGSKYRNQSVHFEVYIPDGHEINIDKGLYWNSHGSQFFERHNRPQNYYDYTWKMTPEGMVSKEWEDQYRATEVLTPEKLTNINIDGDMMTTIEYGEKPEIIIKGTRKNIDKVNQIITGDAVSLDLPRHTSGVSLTIKTPRLETVHAKKVQTLSIKGFQQDQMEINFIGRPHRATTLYVYGDIKDLTCNLGAYTHANLIGSGDQLTINSLKRASIDAENYKVKEINLDGRLSEESTFYATDRFDYTGNSRHYINLLPNPGLLADVIRIND